MTETVIFDLDGTLLDTLGDLAASVNHALRLNGLPARSVQEIRSFLGNGIRVLMERAAGGQARGADFERVFAAFREHYMAHCLDTTRPYPGVMPLLALLRERGIRTGIVSNKLNAAVQELRRHFFNGSIGLAVGEGGGIRRKPDPHGLLTALRQLGGTPERTLYVGDSEVDLQTARNAGVPCALVAWGFRDEAFLRSLPLGGTPVVRRPDELPPLLGVEARA